MIRMPLSGLTAALALLSLSGCALQSPSEVTDAEARDRFIAVLDEAQRTVGGSWDVQDDPTSRDCVVPLWAAGHRYPGLRVGDAPRSIDRSADAVEQLWRDEGMTVERAVVGDVIEVKATSEFGELYVFRVSGSASTLQGESECRPGG